MNANKRFRVADYGQGVGVAVVELGDEALRLQALDDSRFAVDMSKSTCRRS